MSIEPAIYRIYEAAEKAGWEGDPATLAAAIRKLSRGLPVQDEFCALVSWLGQCKLVHGLAQQQYPPASKRHFVVPDLLVVFETPAGEVPVLVEVKSKIRKLSFRSDYFEGLRRYSEMLRIPMLIAWKETRSRFWTLVDVSGFRKANTNYHLSLLEAMRNNLLGMLAGDFMIEFTPGFGMHLHYRKLDHDAEGVRCVVEDAYFQGPRGERFSRLGGGLWPFFLTLDVDSRVEETETHFHQSFIVVEKCGSQFAHRGFPALFAISREKGWRAVLEDHVFVVRPEDMWEAAREASEHSATRGLMRVFPQNVPPFLEGVHEAIRDLRQYS